MKQGRYHEIKDTQGCGPTTAGQRAAALDHQIDQEDAR